MWSKYWCLYVILYILASYTVCSRFIFYIWTLCIVKYAYVTYVTHSKWYCQQTNLYIYALLMLLSKVNYIRYLDGIPYKTNPRPGHCALLFRLQERLALPSNILKKYLYFCAESTRPYSIQFSWNACSYFPSTQGGESVQPQWFTWCLWCVFKTEWKKRNP